MRKITSLRIIAVLLLMLALVMSSCEGKKNEDKTSESTTEAETYYFPEYDGGDVIDFPEVPIDW